MCLGTFCKNRYRLNIDNVRRRMELSTKEDFIGGMRWYKDANAYVESVVSETGIDARIVAAVVSALSPNNPWPKNKIDTLALCKHYISGGSYETAPKVSTYNPNKEKAWRFLTGHSWTNGPKTTCFVDNIINYATSQLVTVDIWAVRVAMDYPEFGTKCEECSAKKSKETGKKEKVSHGPSLTAKDYANISQMYAIVAAEYGILPLECQAICWVAMKNSVGR